MNQLPAQLAPELLLVAVACVLFLLGVSNRIAARKAAPLVALLTLVGLFIYEFFQAGAFVPPQDPASVIHIQSFGIYIKLITAGVGIMLVLLAWPTNAAVTGNSAMNFGKDCGEFFALMLLSICGIFLVASANDIMLLFLGIELASFPTYIMVSISRPLPVAQEAGVKYFFLGAMSAALMLFGFSYLYGMTGQTNLHAIAAALHKTPDATASAAPWLMLALITLLAGLAFKIAAVPMHVYAGDVYQGAATPVTAFLSFVPKTSGFVAIIKVLAVVGGSQWIFPPEIGRLILILAGLTMTFGNVLGLLQYNIKRLLAYSSIAHSGYMLVGVAAMTTVLPSTIPPATAIDMRTMAIEGVLFYLAAYGIMNAAAFGVLMLLPARQPRGWQSRFAPVPEAPAPTATSAETFEDIAGQGRRHVVLGLAMTVACFSLIGIPLTIGFFGKFMLIRPAFTNGLYGLTILLVINAAISAAYYLKIVGTLFLRTDETPVPAVAIESGPSVGTLDYSAGRFVESRRPVGAAVALSVLATLLFGTLLPVTNVLQFSAEKAARDLTHPTEAPMRTALADR